MSSILTDTKKQLGLAEDYTVFDAEIVLYINAVLADLYQLGVGPVGGLNIEDENTLWDELLVVPGDSSVSAESLSSVYSYIYLKVRMLFDPPTLGYLITAYEKMIDEAAWRIMVAADPTVVTPPEDVLISGGYPPDIE